MKYWIIVASKDHVIRARKEGFFQACHGKKWPMERMQNGDGILFYSSKKQFGSSQPYQKFTAAGRIKRSGVYQVTISPHFKPYRRDVEFVSCQEVPIHPLLGQLHFVEGSKSWGYKLISGLLEIDQHDFELISKHMHQNHQAGQLP